MNIKTFFRRAALVAALGFAGAASATVISANTAIGNFIYGPAAQVVVPGMTSAFFANAVGQRFVVLFSAECAVDAPAGNTTAWSDVDIVVLNVAGAVVQTLPPTVGTLGALCSSDGSAGLSGWSSNAVIAVGGPGLPAGTYRVQVRARLNNGATNGSIGERSLVITR